MAAIVFPGAREAFLTGQIDWEGDSFMVIVTDDSVTISEALVYRDDLSGVLATVALTGTASVGNGVADADDCPVPGVAAAAAVERIFIALDTGSAATDLLIYATDVHTDGTPIFRVSDGNPIVIHWANTSNRIFRI